MLQEGLLYGTYRPSCYRTKESQLELLEIAMLATDVFREQSVRTTAKPCATVALEAIRTYPLRLRRRRKPDWCNVVVVVVVVVVKLSFVRLRTAFLLCWLLFRLTVFRLGLRRSSSRSVNAKRSGRSATCPVPSGAVWRSKERGARTRGVAHLRSEFARLDDHTNKRGLFTGR